ncbi:alpha/beta fold hydrolase [Marinimicrococcus flavescens]|uniref:Alpha/beta hydrolase n=1 Tax=Marinimicrococcus flavescens TaxID=3031815 RepID=A0AAP3UZ26_9PROT|nr:alpha/beta hydrolase [Marinimicrococcus flavescens]
MERLGEPGASEPCLVFLHEALGSISLWKDFPRSLCERLGVPGLVYERQGHGASDPLAGPRRPDYLHEEAEQVLPALLEACGIERPVPIGHSDGGSIALLFAAAFPERPAAVIAEAAHVFVEEETLAGIRSAVTAWESTDLPQRLARHHGAGTAALFEAWAGCWLSPAFRHWNIEAALARVTAPLLVLQGEQDEYGTPAQVAAIADGVAGPVEARLLPDCAHVPHHQARERVEALVAGFLGRHLDNLTVCGPADPA